MTPKTINIEELVERGVAYFKQGYNCSQSVTLAFADIYDVPESLMARMSASFGGGMGRMRETCGAASAMFMLAGLQIATPYPDKEVKAKNYAAVQQLAADFKAQTGGTIICRELLQGYVQQIKNKTEQQQIMESSIPEERTDDYYKKRPCIKMVELAIRTYATWLQSTLNPL